MKIGSLVELVDDNWTRPVFRNEINPVKGKVYTIRDFCIVDGSISILLVEIVNDKHDYADGFKERSWYIRRFREINYNASAISELLEEPKAATK